MAIAPIIGLALGAIGTGVSVFGSFQQAGAARSVAEANAAAQRQNAGIEADSIRAQAQLQKIQADQNLKLRNVEAGQRFANADALKQRAQIQDVINARNLKLKGEEGERLIASNRAKYAAGNIAEGTGSSLSQIAELAGTIARDQHETKYANELQRTGLYQEAAMERLGGQYALAGATFDYNSQIAGAGLRNAAADATLLSGNRTANITQLAGNAQAQGYQYAGFGSLLSGGSGVAKQYYDYKQLGAFS